VITKSQERGIGIEQDRHKRQSPVRKQAKRKIENKKIAVEKV